MYGGILFSGSPWFRLRFRSISWERIDGIYHTDPKLHTSQTLSFHNNLPYPPPYFGYPDWESVTLCKYQHYSTLDTYLSLSFHSDTFPEYLPCPTHRRKNTPPYIEYLHHLPHPRRLSLHTSTHLKQPFITYPNLHFPTLYYCQGLIEYKAETTYQIRPKWGRTETTQAETTQTETTQTETTQGLNDSGLKRTTWECSCGCRTETYM